MHRIWLCAIALAMAVPAARAQDPRAEIEQLKRRVEELEKRAGARASGQGAFNPDISLILQGTATRSSENPDDYAIAGFAPSGGEVGPPRRSFGIGESELFLSSNIDPYFRGQLVAALTPENKVEVEEAFFQTLALGGGFTLKSGRFLSAIGYQNSIHSHAWDFQDAPLAHKAFLGGRLNDDGVQLRWVAPTDLFLEAGAELARGRAFPSSDTQRNRAGLWSVFARLGGDLGEAAWRAGLSLLRASPEGRGFTDRDSLGNAEVAHSFSGRSRLWIADAVVKWPRFKLQAEYFRRREDGELAYDDSASATPQFGAAFRGDYASRQSGGYAQAVYSVHPRWRVGYRFDRLGHGSVANGIVASGAGPTAADFPLLMSAHDPRRHTAMLDWSASEFSRLRLQLASDRSRAGVTDRQVLLQYIFSLGAHGAHPF